MVRNCKINNILHTSEKYWKYIILRAEGSCQVKKGLPQRTGDSNNIGNIYRSSVIQTEERIYFLFKHIQNVGL